MIYVTFQHFLCSLWHAFYYFCQFLLFAVPIPYLNDDLYEHVMETQSNSFNRDFAVDHKFSMELRSGEFLDQSNTYNLCFLNIAFNFRKCPSHIYNDSSFNFTNVFVWMCRTLNWLKSGVSNIRHSGKIRPVAWLDPARGMILWNKNFFICLRSLSSYTSITGDYRFQLLATLM